MNRTLIATAFVAALLPVTALPSAAAPFEKGYVERTYQLGCRLNANDGESLKVRMMVSNTTGRVIPKGTKIEVTFHTRYGRDFKASRTAWRDIQAQDAIGFDRPDAKGTTGCSASVTFSNIGMKAKKFPHLPR